MRRGADLPQSAVRTGCAPTAARRGSQGSDRRTGLRQPAETIDVHHRRVRRDAARGGRPLRARQRAGATDERCAPIAGGSLGSACWEPPRRRTIADLEAEEMAASLRQAAADLHDTDPSGRGGGAARSEAGGAGAGNPTDPLASSGRQYPRLYGICRQPARRGGSAGGYRRHRPDHQRRRFRGRPHQRRRNAARRRTGSCWSAPTRWPRA